MMRFSFDPTVNDLPTNFINRWLNSSSSVIHFFFCVVPSISEKE
jgi:hypothetical protein